MERTLKILLVIIAVLAVLFVAIIATVANAEQTEKPHFVYAAYEPGGGVNGVVYVPDEFERCYVVAKFYINKSFYVPALISIDENGIFKCKEMTAANWITLWIVDNNFIFEKEHFVIYDRWLMNWGTYEAPD